MRSTLLRATPVLLAVVLAGCGDVTMPWTEAPSGSAYAVSPTALTFQAQAGSATPAAQRLNVKVNAGPVYLAVTSSGAATATLTIDSSTQGHVDVTVQPPSFAGTYHGTVTIDGCADSACTTQVAGSPVVVPVTYVVTAAPVTSTTLEASVASLSFQQAAGAADPTPQTITLSLHGGGSSAFYSCIATWDTPLTWITWTPTQGTSLPATVTVSMHGAGLPPGTTRSGGLIFQTVPCGQGLSGVEIPVTFTVQ